MSQEKTLQNLKDLGFSVFEAQIYLLLGKKGPLHARDIVKRLKINRQRLYEILKELEKKGLIHSTLEYPAKFGAEPFEKVLDLFVEAKMEEALRIKENTKRLIEDWQSISSHETVEQRPRFMVFEGRNYIYPHLRNMIQETKKELLLINSPSGLIKTEQYGLLETVFQHSKKEKIVTRYLTEITLQNVRSIRQFLERIKTLGNFEGRSPNLGLQLTSRMLIKDNSEVVFFINKTNGETDDSDDICLWTNSNSIVTSFKSVFENLWHNSTDIKRKIVEIETGKPTSQSLIIRDYGEVKRKYIELISQAEKEITILTSSKGLDEVLRFSTHLKEKAKKGISIKIMMPITKNNLKSVSQLSEFCKVRHISTSYLNTIVIDRMHIFQFKNPSSNQKSPVESNLENTFYTNETEYSEMTNSMLESIWENSYEPSAITLEEFIKPLMPLIAPVPDEEYSISKKDGPHQKNVIKIDEEPDLLAEKDILNKVINAKRKKVKNLSKCTNILYGSIASAVFHPPSSFNLPDMIIIALHSNKKSTFGSGDSLQIHLWLETPKGHAYVPVAFVVDNPKSRNWAKAFFASTPAGNNCQLIGKDELEIQVQGNTFFVGWTVPIPLFPTKYTLPPACLLFEGYGKLKTSVIKMEMPSGGTLVMEGNGFDAFATFFHPASKYAGPGTDATIGREIIMTASPVHSNKVSRTTV